MKNTSDHYQHGNLLQNILNGLEVLGKSIDTVSIVDLAPVDEFHIGGRAATKYLLSNLGLDEQVVVLDIGCGIGGASRYVANIHDAKVTGIDLTSEYVEVGRELNSWVGLSEKITLFQGSATQMPFGESLFGAAIMLHVGMNIQDKQALFNEIYRVLAPGAKFALYDIMFFSDEPIQFPVPWASGQESSFVESPQVYEQGLISAGFEIQSIENRSGFAKEFFQKMKVAMDSKDWPPALGLHLVMGMDAPIKYANMMTSVLNGQLAPVQIIATKPLTN